MDPKLLIFDIDGTLTDSGGLSRIAFEKAAKDIYHIDEASKGIKPYGLTDRIIFQKILSGNSLVVENFDNAFRKFRDCFTVYFRKLISTSDKTKLFPGVKSLLLELDFTKGIYLTLGTGNVKSCAYLKLEKHSIDLFFPVGGFGDHLTVREEIIRAAYCNAIEEYGISFSKKSTWVIGDTPIDVMTGKKLGFNTLAVANGHFDQFELAEYQPSGSVSGLEKTEEILSIFQTPIN